jgi:hypothetical protein
MIIEEGEEEYFHDLSGVSKYIENWNTLYKNNSLLNLMNLSILLNFEFVFMNRKEFDLKNNIVNYFIDKI